MNFTEAMRQLGCGQAVRRRNWGDHRGPNEYISRSAMMSKVSDMNKLSYEEHMRLLEIGSGISRAFMTDIARLKVSPPPSKDFSFAYSAAIEVAGTFIRSTIKRFDPEEREAVINVAREQFNTLMDEIEGEQLKGNPYHKPKHTRSIDFGGGK